MFSAKFQIKKHALALITATVIFLNGCGTYNALEGEREPDKNSAVLYVSPFQEFPPLVPFGSAYVLIINLDGEPIGDIWFSAASVIYVEPGQRTVGLHYNYCAFGCKDKWWALKFDAKPGHHYRGYARNEGDQYWAWIEDEETGEVVSGVKQPST